VFIGDYAFYNCKALTGIVIPAGVTAIGEGAFYNCSGLTFVTLPAGLKEIGGYAFTGCSALLRVTIPSGVTRIGTHAFSGNSALLHIIIPDSVLSIGSYAFSNCSNLTIWAAAKTQPSGWTGDPLEYIPSWNHSNRPVVWGCTFVTEANGVYVAAFTKIPDAISNLSGAVTPYRQGYAFGGWNDEPDGSGTAYPLANQTQYDAIPDGTILYAIWI
jgi:hypothetical protein